jgi:hypothetical protein
MGQKRQSTKRPCRICKKWFLPNPRLGDRQKTCGTTECQQQWHTRKCTEWNRKNRSYFQENYLKRRLESLDAISPEPTPSTSPPPSPMPPLQPIPPLDYPRGVVQEVIGAQQLVIIEFIVRLLKRGVQEVIISQHVKTHREFQGLPSRAISRGDSQRPP